MTPTIYSQIQLMIDKENKVIIIDFSIFMFRSIFCWERNRELLPTYTTLSMLISCLKTIGCHPDDLIILALDSPKGSWRKDIDGAYKADRKEKRKKHDINWTEMFDMFKVLLLKLKESTPWIQIVIDKLEADDIISASVRYFKDNIITIVSSDSDYEQLAEFSNVKLFSTISKKYKIVKNPSKILADKIRKETTDNLVTKIVTDEDYKRREMIVNLLKLPIEIENKVIQELSNIRVNYDFDLTKLPFLTMRSRFMDIYRDIRVKEVENKDIPKIKIKKPLVQKLLTL